MDLSLDPGQGVRGGSSGSVVGRIETADGMQRTDVVDFQPSGLAAWPPVLLRTQHFFIRSALAKLIRYRRKLAVRYQVKAHLVINVYP